MLLNDITVIISLMNYSAQRFDSAQLQTLTFSNTKGAGCFFYPSHHIKSTQGFCGHSCEVTSTHMMGVVPVIRCVRGLEWRIDHVCTLALVLIQFYWSIPDTKYDLVIENHPNVGASLPESSDALSGVRMLGPVCSTSTWMSSVSSVFFLCELFFWLSPWDNRALFLSLLFLLSPGSLRSSRSRVEERTVRRWHMVSFSSEGSLIAMETSLNVF